jgi:hypothetical protein
MSFSTATRHWDAARPAGRPYLLARSGLRRGCCKLACDWYSTATPRSKPYLGRVAARRPSDEINGAAIALEPEAKPQEK